MEKYIVTTGKTIDQAIEAALVKLGKDRDSVSVEVLKNARSGFLGIGASPAEVKVTYEVPDEEAAPKTALSSASRTKPKSNMEMKATASTEVISRPGKKIEQEQKAEPKKAESKKPEEKKAGPKKVEAKKVAAKKQERQAEPKVVKPKVESKPTVNEAQTTDVQAVADDVKEQIETFLKGLLEHMGSDAVPHATQVAEEIYQVELVGGDAGILIGRRGDTLDAIQYLTGYAVNRNRDKRVRISVDAGNYRLRREEALVQLANKMAAKAVKYHRNFTLEPMNAYERHVIHAALQNYPEVTTHSTGMEPHRRIVVSYAKEAK